MTDYSESNILPGLKGSSTSKHRPVRTRSYDLWHLVICYVLLIPMLFFAAGGELSFESKAGKTQSGSFQNKAAAMQTSEQTSQRMAETVLTFPILLAVIALNWRRVASERKNAQVFLLAAYWAIASSLWSQEWITSLRNGIYLLINTLFALYLSKRFSPKGQMQLFAVVGVVFLMLNAAVAIALPRYGVTSGVGGGANWQGICIHKNLCSYVTVFLMTPFVFMKPRTPVGAVGRYLVLIGSLIVVYKTQSRTGWVLAGALLLLVGYLRVLRRFAPKDGTTVNLISAVVGIGVAVPLLPFLPELFILMGKDPTLTGRLPIWAAVMISIAKHPILGYGFHAFWTGTSGESSNIALSLFWDPGFAHNGLLEIWLGVGLVGVVLVLYSFFYAVRHAMATFWVKGSAAVDWYISIIFLTVVVNIDEGTLLGTTHLAWTMYMMACIALSRTARGIIRDATSQTVHGTSLSDQAHNGLVNQSGNLLVQ